MSFFMGAIPRPERQDYHLWGTDSETPFIISCGYCGMRIPLSSARGSIPRYGCPENPALQKIYPNSSDPNIESHAFETD